MEAQTLPSLFVPHGAPDLVLSDIPARSFLQGLGKQLPLPRGIVIISAHWSTPQLEMTGPSYLKTIHDYSGWQPALYEIKYQASGADWLNQLLESTLSNVGYPVHNDSHPGLDHGAWVPLFLMYPKADIPIVHLSMQHAATPEQHFRVGEALDSLRQKGILVIGSGGVVHNLRSLRPEGTPPESWAKSFEEWLWKSLKDRKLPDLFHYAHLAENAMLAHPTNEHLMPMFVAMGAGWSSGTVQQIHHSFSYGNISMASYAFGLSV